MRANLFISLCASPLSDNFTNLQVHPLFIPFLYYLANTGMEIQDLYYRIGGLKPLSMEIENAPKKGPARIAEIDGDYDVIPEQFWDPVSGRLMLHLGNYKGSAGILELTRSDKVEAIIAMNYSKGESQIEKLPREEINRLIMDSGLTNISITGVEAESGSADIIKIKDKTFSLVRIMLLLDLIFLSLESLIHRIKS